MSFGIWTKPTCFTLTILSEFGMNYNLYLCPPNTVEAHALCSAIAILLISLITDPGSGDWVMAVPETIMFAPAEQHSFTVAGPTPPSTSISVTGG